MSEPRWLTQDQVIIIHELQLRRHGGPPGLRDAAMLDSALMRPQNKFGYGETDLVTLAAAYAYGLARNHPFVDGNKRIAFIALVTFLRRNGIAFAPAQANATQIMLELAAGSVNEDGLIRWIRDTLAAR